MTTPDAIQAAAASLKKRSRMTPSVALILGSGLGSFAEQMEDPVRISAREISGYPLSTVEGHAGSLIFGRFSHQGRRSPECLVFQGRVHYYESGDLSTAVAPVQLAHALGIRSILITNAAGGIDRTLLPGDLMLIEDVLSVGPIRLPSQGRSHHVRATHLFDARLQHLLQEAAHNTLVSLKKGTYAWVHGPSYETAAEIRMLRVSGAHAVGMSTVPEVLEARRLDMRVVGISLISNMGTGILPDKLSHEEVTSTAQASSAAFSSLIRSFLTQLDDTP